LNDANVRLDLAEVNAFTTASSTIPGRQEQGCFYPFRSFAGTVHAHAIETDLAQRGLKKSPFFTNAKAAIDWLSCQN